MSLTIVWISLLVLLLAACAYDLRERRIPNGVAVAGLLMGLALQASVPAGTGFFAAAQPGAEGLLRAGGAALAMCAAGIVLWRLRLFGAGDAKLLTAVAAFAGLSGVVPVLLATLIAGGVLALVWRSLRLIPAAAAFATSPMGVRLPYSFAIAAGTVGYAAMNRAGLLAT